MPAAATTASLSKDSKPVVQKGASQVVNPKAANPSKASDTVSKASTKTMKQLAAPQTLGDIVVDLAEISVDQDSGWRDLNDARVSELKACFERGEYGQNLLRKPSVLQFAGGKLKCKDGLLRLADGKNTVRALQELKQAHDAKRNDALEASDATVYSEALMKVLTEGLSVTVLEFPEFDDDVAFAWAAGIHDIDNNKFQATSLQDLVEVVRRFQKRVPGGRLKETQELLEQVYGANRRMFVYRMVAAAKSLSPVVLAKLSTSIISNSYVNENKFFLGTGGDAGKVLTDKGKLAVIEIANGDLLEGKAMSKASFVSEYCTPMRHAEAWLASKHRDFGKLAELPIFQRVEVFLLTSRARPAILNCLRSSIRLEGISDDQPGIEQCRTLVKELTILKMRSASNALTASTSQGTAEDTLAASSDKTNESLGNKDEAVGTVAIAADDEVDPLDEKAKGKTDMALTKLSYYDSGDDMLKILPSVVMPSHRVLVLIDAPTSKSKVVVKLIDQAAATLKCLSSKQCKVAVSVGNRPDLFAAVNSKLELAFPKSNTFNIQLISGDKQSKRRKPAFLVVSLPSDSLEEMPTSIPALKARAMKGEKTRFRCMSASCPFRPRAEMDALASDGNLDLLNPDCEMNPDDMEWMAEDADGIAEEDVGDDDDITMPSSDRKFRVDVWPFAYCKDFYKHIISGLCNGTVLTPNHVVVFTVTAHPSAVLACHDVKAEVHCVLDRVKEHSKAHGQDLLRECLQKAFYAEEKARESSGTSTKRWLSKELPFVTVQADSLQTVLFADVAHDGSTPLWRANLDQAPTPTDLEDAVTKLMAHEVEADSLVVVDDANGGRSLITTKAIKEGDMVVLARCLLFSKSQNVAEFVNSGGNSALLEGPLIHITNVETPLGNTTELFAVLVGIGMFVQDFRGKKARPNACLKFVPGKGCNDGVLTFVASTRNACGIAAGGTILADFGEIYRPLSLTEPSSAAKKFRGALDLVFNRQMENTQEPANLPPPTPSGTPNPTPRPKAADTPVDPQVIPSGEGSNASKDNEIKLVATSDYEIIFKEGKTLLIRPLASNTRISPKTVLVTFSAGSVDVEANQAITASLFAFHFSKPRVNVVNHGAKSVTSLGEFIKSENADKLFCHAAFTKGNPPPSFVVKKDMYYHGPNAEMAAIQAAIASPKLSVLWSVACITGKVTPKGVAILPASQIALKAGQDFIL